MAYVAPQNIWDLYGSALGGGDPGSFGDDSLGYLDAVLRGQKRYSFDRDDSSGYPAGQPQAASQPQPAPAIDEDGYTTFAEPEPRQPPQPQPPQPPQQPQTFDVGTGIPFNLDRTPVPDTGEGTHWNQFKRAPGDILTAALGLLERGQLGGMNALGMRQDDGDIYRAKIPVEPGLRAAEGALTFGTAGLASSLFPAAGALRAGAQYALPAARGAAAEARPVIGGLLADQSGALNLTPRQRRLQEITLGRPLASAPDLPPSEIPTAGSNSLLYNQQMLPEPFTPAPPAPRERQVAPNIPKGRAPSFGEQLRAQHLENEDALPLVGARMQVVAPPHITNEQELDALVDRYVQDALAGKAGKHWYEASGGGILQHAGSPEVATPFAGGLARTSPQTDVASNLTHAVTMHNQYMAGDPLNAGRFPNAMGADVEKIYRGGEKVTGEKIGPFMGAVANQWDPGMFPHQLVNDIWNMRILEYPGQGGALYHGSPTSGQHNFARIVADRARKKLEEQTGETWLPRQVQASGWTGGKARLEGTTANEAAFNFNDALRRNYAQLSWESAPGPTTGHFPEFHSAPWEVREQYHKDIRDALSDENGRDIIAAHLGLMTGRTFDRPGYFEGAANPGSQSPVAVGQAPGGSLQGIDAASRELIGTSERVRALLLRQDAGAANKPLWAGNIPVNKRDLFDVTLGRALTPDETVAIAKAMHAATGTDWHSPIGTAGGYRFINVPEASGISNQQFVAAAHKVLAEANIPGVQNVTARQTASDGFYEYNNWKENPDGEVYRRGLGAARSPDLQRRAAELLATLGERVGRVNDRYAKTHGWTQGPQRRFWEEPAYQDFKTDVIPRTPRPGEIRSTAEIGPGWRPLFGPGSILGSLLGLIGGSAAGGAAMGEAQAAPGQPPDAFGRILQQLGAP